LLDSSNGLPEATDANPSPPEGACFLFGLSPRKDCRVSPLHRSEGLVSVALIRPAPRWVQGAGVTRYGDLLEPGLSSWTGHAVVRTIRIKRHHL